MPMQGLISNVRHTPRGAYAKGFATSATMLMLGDTLCQAIQLGGFRELRREWDVKRTARFGVIGLTLHGPTFFTGFRAVDGYFGNSRGLPAVVKKTVTVQMLVFPPFLATFFYYIRRLEGRSHEAGVQSIKDNFGTAFAAGSLYWPCVNILNFSFMPTDKRLLFTSSAAVLYNTFLSWVNTRKSSPLKQSSKLGLLHKAQ